MKRCLHLVALEGVPIFEQLQLEEALLRAGDENYCLINHASPPAIVMGISGVAHELIDLTRLQANPVPVIRRFSGGGTVLIEQETLFLTFIFNQKDVDIGDVDIGKCPKRLLQWTEAIIKPALPSAFGVRENDYCIGDKKIGGNAQYFTKDRWLHHTSLLWDYSDEAMQLLKMPAKVPAYRQARAHSAFLDRLKHYYPSKQELLAAIMNELHASFEVVHCSWEVAERIKARPHRQATVFVV